MSNNDLVAYSKTKLIVRLFLLQAYKKSVLYYCLLNYYYYYYYNISIFKNR